MTSDTHAASPAGRRRILDPSERFGELLFGLIMVLTFTGSLSAATSGHADVRTMLIGAIGCNLAWGIVDGIMYILDNLGQRGRDLLTLHRVLGAPRPEIAQGLIADALPAPVAAVLRPDELESIRKRLSALPEPPRKGGLERNDFLGALGIFLVVFLSTFPVVIPFLVMPDAMKALRVSNAIAIGMLFLGGYFLAKSSGYRPWRTGLVMVAIGVVLVAITIALGG